MQNAFGLFFDFWLDTTVYYCCFHAFIVLHLQHKVKRILHFLMLDSDP